MVISERVHVGSHYYKHTYSDKKLTIIQKETNTEYDEAYDLMSAEFTYEETDHKIGYDATQLNNGEEEGAV